MHNGQLECQLNSKGSHAGNRTRAMAVKTARSSPLDHMGILGFLEMQFPSMKAGRRRTFIAKIIGEFNFRNILRWRGIEPRSPAWQARILRLNHQRYRSFIPILQSFETA